MDRASEWLTGESFRLADEVRYVQRCAAKHDGRIITIGQLILFSTETGDTWPRRRMKKITDAGAMH